MKNLLTRTLALIVFLALTATLISFSSTTASATRIKVPDRPKINLTVKTLGYDGEETFTPPFARARVTNRDGFIQRVILQHKPSALQRWENAKVQTFSKSFNKPYVVRKNYAAPGYWRVKVVRVLTICNPMLREKPQCSTVRETFLSTSKYLRGPAIR